MKRKSRKQSLSALLDQFQLINRINMALTSSLKLEDIYSITLAALVSQFGLGFSRALIFRYDRKRKRFYGYKSLGSLEAADAAQMRSEMKEEFEFIDNALKELETNGTTSKEDYLESSLSSLRSSALWITAYQKYGQNTPLNQLISNLTFSYVDGDKGTPLKDAIDANDILICGKRSRLSEFPESFYSVFDGRFMVAPLRTKKGVLALILVDKKFEQKIIGDTDMRYLQWFCNQASLVVDNADLFEDLQAAYDDLKQMDTLKTSFLSIISHELRTPLTAILGFTDLLINEKVGTLTPVQRDLLERVEKNSHHLSHVVNDLIEVTHIQAEESSKIHLGAIDPLNVLMNAQPKLQLRRREKKVSVEPVIPDSLPLIISNAEALEKILFHLLDNAIKFSEENSEVRVTFMEDDGEVHIGINDHGIGIPEDRLKSIFDLFYQVDNRLSRTHEGLGLGLTITKMLTAATGGRLDVKSEVGVGSTFTVIYPISKKGRKTGTRTAISSR